MTNGRELLTAAEKVRKGARLYHAFKALIEANGFTSAAFRCWPEVMQIENMSACLSIGWLLSEGVVRAAACEGDWPTAVCQSIGNLLSGKPAACLDFINHVGARSVVQLAHCGVGIPCLMEDAKIGEISPDRQGGASMGPTCIGQFCYGVKTGHRDDPGQRRQVQDARVHRRESAGHAAEPAGGSGRRGVAQPAKLNRLILATRLCPSPGHGGGRHQPGTEVAVRFLWNRVCES